MNTQNENIELSKTKRGNKYLIICIDDFSKYVELQPIPNKESITIRDWFLNEIIKRYGKPKQIRTDRGIEFGQHFANLLNDLDI